MSGLTPAERLRETARLLRERAEDATLRSTCEHEDSAWVEHDAQTHCLRCDLAVVAEHLGTS